MKNWVEFSLTSFDTLKYHCVIKAIEIFNILLITTGFSFFIINHINNHIIKNY